MNPSYIVNFMLLLAQVSLALALLSSCSTAITTNTPILGCLDIKQNSLQYRDGTASFNCDESEVRFVVTKDASEQLNNSSEIRALDFLPLPGPPELGPPFPQPEPDILTQQPYSARAWVIPAVDWGETSQFSPGQNIANVRFVNPNRDNITVQCVSLMRGVDDDYGLPPTIGGLSSQYVHVATGARGTCYPGNLKGWMILIADKPIWPSVERVENSHGEYMREWTTDAYPLDCSEPGFEYACDLVSNAASNPTVTGSGSTFSNVWIVPENVHESHRTTRGLPNTTTLTHMYVLNPGTTERTVSCISFTANGNLVLDGSSRITIPPGARNRCLTLRAGWFALIADGPVLVSSVALSNLGSSEARVVPSYPVSCSDGATQRFLCQFVH